MNETVVRDLERRVKELEREAMHMRRGVVSTLKPLGVTLGGAETAIPDVSGAADARLNEGVNCLVGSNDMFVLGRSDPGPWRFVGGIGTDEVAFQNTWTNYNAFGFGIAAAYRRLQNGLVVMRGLVKRASGTFPSTIFTLPVNYRPNENILFAVLTNDVLGRMDVNSDGTISAQAGSNVYFQINACFYADQ